MVPVLTAIVAFSMIIGLIVFIIRYQVKKNRQKNDLYKELGLRLNLTYTEQKHFFIRIPHLSGNWQNHHVEIYERIVGSGKNQTVYTNIQFNRSPHNFEFRIGKEYFFSKIGKKIGFKDIEFDDLDLDKTFLFKSKEEDRFRTLMDYRILHDLQGVASSMRGSIKNQNGLLTYTFVGVANKPEKIAELEKILRFMGKLMDRP